MTLKLFLQTYLQNLVELGLQFNRKEKNIEFTGKKDEDLEDGIGYGHGLLLVKVSKQQANNKHNVAATRT